jgi:hypothetical protein
MPEDLVDIIYQKTHHFKHPSWGDYVTISEIEEYWRRLESVHKASPGSSSSIHKAISDLPLNGEDNNKTVLVEMAARYIELAMSAIEENSNGTVFKQYGDSCESIPLFSLDDLRKAHGVAIWSLRAPVGSQVRYVAY